MKKRYFIVARHEFTTQLRRKSFLFMAFVFPLLMVGINIFTTSWISKKEEETGTLGQIGVVDLSGVLVNEAEKPAEYVQFADEETAVSALLSDEIGAYFVLPADYVAMGTVEGYSKTAVSSGIERQLATYIEANLLADTDPHRAARLRDPAAVTMSTLDGRREFNEETGMAMVMAPIIFAMIFGMSINMTSSFMMQNVVEEKETRMVEMMITSITPTEMLTGKLLGMAAIGGLQILSWVVTAGVVAIVRADLLDTIAALQFPKLFLLTAVFYLILGYILYGGLLSGVGASADSMQEAQSLAVVFSIAALSPLFFIITFLKDPNGVWPTVLSIVPFTASTSMVMRLSLTDVPAWQVGVSMLLLVGTTVFVVWLSAWIFRVGMLMTGKSLLKSVRPDRFLYNIRAKQEALVKPVRSSPQRQGGDE